MRNFENAIPTDEASFEEMFTTHYKGMFSYAFTILGAADDAEEIVQNVFLKIWEKKESLQVESSLKSYLYRMVHNGCMNFINHLAVKAKYQKEKIRAMQHETDNAGKKVIASELEQKIAEALRELPEQCRTIFQLSRFEELKYREIAHHLGISEKTVENQMGKALKILRLKLVDFLPMLISFISFLKSR